MGMLRELLNEASYGGLSRTREINKVCWDQQMMNKQAQCGRKKEIKQKTKTSYKTHECSNNNEQCVSRNGVGKALRGRIVLYTQSPNVYE